VYNTVNSIGETYRNHSPTQQTPQTTLRISPTQNSRPDEPSINPPVIPSGIIVHKSYQKYYTVTHIQSHPSLILPICPCQSLLSVLRLSQASLLATTTRPRSYRYTPFGRPLWLYLSAMSGLFSFPQKNIIACPFFCRFHKKRLFISYLC
jgi:hypothetical protein